MERLGRSMHVHAMTYDRMLAHARKVNGNERGLIVITPDTTAVSHPASDSQLLVLDASIL